jgi:hypothetical protein
LQRGDIGREGGRRGDGGCCTAFFAAFGSGAAASAGLGEDGFNVGVGGRSGLDVDFLFLWDKVGGREEGLA